MKDKRQFIVWGLGRFGSSVAETLTALGHEVLGIDNNEDVVENMADKLTHAVVCDVIDEKTVNSLGIREIRCKIVAIGTLEPNLPGYHAAPGKQGWREPLWPRPPMPLHEDAGKIRGHQDHLSEQDMVSRQVSLTACHQHLGFRGTL